MFELIWYISMEREVSQKLKKTKKMRTSESITWDLSQAPFAKFMLHVRFFWGGRWAVFEHRCAKRVFFDETLT